jgi:hypothetical protein
MCVWPSQGWAVVVQRVQGSGEKRNLHCYRRTVGAMTRLGNAVGLGADGRGLRIVPKRFLMSVKTSAQLLIP